MSNTLCVPATAQGDLLNAELVLSQSTTDANGIYKTLGIYPSIPTATSASSAGSVGHYWRYPEVKVREYRATFEGTLWRSAGSGAVYAHLHSDGGSSPIASLGTLSGTPDLERHTPPTWSVASNSLMSNAVALQLTSAAVRVSGTDLRLAITLRDTTSPTLTNWRVTQNPQFSPNGDGAKDSATFGVNIADYSPPFTWKATVTQSGSFVRDDEGTVSGTGDGTPKTASASYTWYGKNEANVTVTSGQYDVSIAVTDDAGNTATTTTVPVIVDLVAPDVTNPAATPTRFGPNAPSPNDKATFTATVHEAVPWRVRILNSSGVAVHSSPSVNCSLPPCDVTYDWAGAGASSDGLYAGRIEATDPAGNTGSSTTPNVERDSTGPSIASIAATNANFSPDGPSPVDRHTTTLTTSLEENWQPISWTLSIKWGASTIRSVSGTNTDISYAWDGTDENGDTVQDGVYTVILNATDGGSNTSSRSRTVRVDTRAPSLGDLLPLDKSVTVYNPQRILLNIDENGAGVSLSDITFTRTSASGVSVTIGAADYNATTGWARTAALVTAPGRYSVSVTVKDLAGNEASVGHASVGAGGGFVATTMTVGSSSVSIPETSCQLSAPNYSTLTQLATCQNVYVTASPAMVAFGEMPHSEGSGILTAPIALATAKFVHKVAPGVEDEQPAYNPAETVWEDRTAVFRFHVRQPSSGPASFTAWTSGDGLVGTVSGRVPLSWTNAHIRMNSVSVTPASLACSDPSVALAKCVPDPVQASQWDPQLGVRHHELCDTALGHRPKIVVSSGENLPLGVSVDQSRIQPTLLRLTYSIDHGPTKEVSVSGTGSSSYTLSIPASDLHPNAVIDYAFTAQGTTTQACAPFSMAIAPTRFGYKSLAVEDPEDSDSFDSTLRGIWGLYASLAAEQPGYASTNVAPSIDEVCASFFAGPSPCALLASTDYQTPPSSAPLTPPAGLPLAASGPGPKSCKFPLPSFAMMRANGEEGTGKSWTMRSGPEARPDPYDATQPARAGVRHHTASKAGPVANEYAWGKTQVLGYAGFIDSEGDMGAADVTARLRWTVHGDSWADAWGLPTPCGSGPISKWVCEVIMGTTTGAEAIVGAPSVASGVYEVRAADGGILREFGNSDLWQGTALKTTSWPGVPIIGNPQRVAQTLGGIVRTRTWPHLTMEPGDNYWFWVELLTGVITDAGWGVAEAHSDFFSPQHPSAQLDFGLELVDVELTFNDDNHWESCFELEQSP